VNLENRERKNPKTREGKNKKQQEKEREDRGSFHQDPTKTNKHHCLLISAFLRTRAFQEEATARQKSHRE
jgi:hypothetical protein